jgi:hypothetical protein
VSLIFIHGIKPNYGKVIGINHTETINLELNKVVDILSECNNIFVRDKKETLHYLNLNNLEDCNFEYPIYEPKMLFSQSLRLKKYVGIKHPNTLLPCSKHYEYCYNIFSELKQNLIKIDTKYYKFFNRYTIPIFKHIESNGIEIDFELFSKQFYKNTNPKYFSVFNIKNMTTRPSNSFNGINLMALNQKNNSKECFIPKNDYLVELDIKAYHPTIAAKLIDYKFPTTDIHQYFADLYKKDYKEAKFITFKQFYGGIKEEYKHLEFFNLLDKYIQNLWSGYQTKGYIESPISGFRFKKENLKDLYPQKLFNYHLQEMETSINLMVLDKIIPKLKNKKTKIVHYVYDSILIDFSKEDQNIIPEIISIFGKFGFIVEGKAAKNYNEI